MIKYKLIKTYPGSHPKGAISKVDYSNYPEFWEKVEELDYEILSFYSGHSDDKMAYIFTKNSNGLYSKGTGDCDLNHALRYWNIHSIKRLSDGEVFTIGDVVSSDLNRIKKAIIEEFIIHKDSKEILLACGEKIIGFLPGGININAMHKYKSSLFTTEDGVDIFEGDDFSVVQLKTFQIINECKYPLTNPLNWACFSSEEKAQEYVLLNKPMLSLQDLLNVWGVSDEIGAYKTSLMFNKFEKLAKSKL